MENKFGRVSSLKLTTLKKDGKTILDDVFFTAPFKITHPFPKKDGGIQVMQLSVSAGIMEGDVQEVELHVRKGCSLELASQSFEKIHKMKEGYASRKTKLKVEKDAYCDYSPLPTIPFADSAFQNKMEVELEDETSRFLLQEVISCGRKASGERFTYRFYHSRVNVRCKGRLIYRDNTRYEPKSWPMEGIGMMEGFSHLGNLLFCNMNIAQAQIKAMRDCLEEADDVEGGVTQLESGDIAVRMLGQSAQKIQQIEEVLKKEAGL